MLDRVLNTPLIKVRSMFTSLLLFTWGYLNHTLKPYAWRGDVGVNTTAQLHLTTSELRFYAGSNPIRGVSEICDGENL